MSRELLKRAIEEAIDEDMSFIPDGKEIKEMHEFSVKKDRQIRNLMKVKKKQYFFRTVAGIAACLAVCILAGNIGSFLNVQNKSMTESASQNICDEEVNVAKNEVSNEVIDSLNKLTYKKISFDGQKCTILFERGTRLENDDNDCTIRLQTTSVGEDAVYTVPYETQRLENGELEIQIAEFPEEYYTSVYVIFGQQYIEYDAQ